MFSGPPSGSALTGIPGRHAGKTRNPWGVWLLGLVTLGIYQLWWYYEVNRELRDYDEHIDVQPGVALVAVLFGGILLGIPPIVSWVKTGGRIAQAQRLAGSTERCSGLVGVLLALIGFGSVYYQSQINKVWDAYGNPLPGTPLPR
jgi:hypothetical protein